jgi:urea transport system substrate-binding protein
VSRKSVLPVFEKNNGLLFYPVQYEGEEESPNVAYTAEAVNQQATPAVDYMIEKGYKKFYLLGSDYVYPQTTNLVLLEYLQSKGVALESIGGGFKKDESGKIISCRQSTLPSVTTTISRSSRRLSSSPLAERPASSTR